MKPVQICIRISDVRYTEASCVGVFQCIQSAKNSFILNKVQKTKSLNKTKKKINYLQIDLKKHFTSQFQMFFKVVFMFTMNKKRQFIFNQIRFTSGISIFILSTVVDGALKYVWRITKTFKHQTRRKTTHIKQKTSNNWRQTT